MMQRLETYPLHPGSCRLCSSSRTPTIDTGLPFDSDGYGGVLYICTNCVSTMAGMLGWKPASDEAVLTAKLDRLRNDLADTVAENDRLQAQIDAMIDAEAARLTNARQRIHSAARKEATAARKAAK